jgi:hypothetical protein
VAAAVYRLLYETGVIQPEDVVGDRHAESPQPAFSGAAAAPESHIWTPQSDRPASGGKKSSLWTPS